MKQRPAQQRRKRAFTIEGRPYFPSKPSRDLLALTGARPARMTPQRLCSCCGAPGQITTTTVGKTTTKCLRCQTKAAAKAAAAAARIDDTPPEPGR